MTIVMDIEALKADKNLEHFADYAISESYVVEAPTYDLANVEVSKQLSTILSNGIFRTIHHCARRTLGYLSYLSVQPTICTTNAIL